MSYRLAKAAWRVGGLHVPLGKGVAKQFFLAAVETHGGVIAFGATPYATTTPGPQASVADACREQLPQRVQLHRLDEMRVESRFFGDFAVVLLTLCALGPVGVVAYLLAGWLAEG